MNKRWANDPSWYWFQRGMIAVFVGLLVVIALSLHRQINELECEQVHREWLASDQPFLDWSTVDGCDGLG